MHLERRRAIIPFIPYIAVSALHVGLLLADYSSGGYGTKQLLLAMLVLAAVWATWRLRPRPRPAMTLLLIGLVASWVGDGAGLFFPGLPELPTMILFFGVAHLAYIALFWRAPGVAGVRRVPRWAIVYAVWWIATLAIVGPHAGGLFVPLALYGLVLGGTAALSTRFGALVASGGAFFLVSDTLIALREFMHMPAWIDQLVMPTYVLGQGLIVFGTILRFERSSHAGAAGESLGGSAPEPGRAGR